MRRQYSYSIHNGELIIKNEKFCLTTYSGKPRDVEIVEFKQIPYSDDVIVLLNWRKIAAEVSIKNILRLEPTGVIVWEVGDPPPQKQILGIDRTNDIYTGIVEVKSTHLVAFAWSGFVDYIDISTGKVTDYKFHK